MAEDASAPGHRLSRVAYVKSNVSNPMSVPTTASAPEPPEPSHTEFSAAVAPTSGHEGLNPGAVAGLAIGLALGVLLLAAMICVGYRSQQRRRDSHTDGRRSLGKPSREGPIETDKSPLVHVSRTPHFGPCSKLARPSWTMDRNASHLSQSAKPRPSAAPPRPKRPTVPSIVGRDMQSPSEGSFLRSPRRPCSITSAASIQIPQPLRVYRPPTPYYSNFKTYKPRYGIDPFTVSKLEGSDLGTHNTYEVMEV